jgi:ribosomal protein S18 acetylase RimI-like enzyme
VRDARGAILAAAAGHSWGGTAELKQVWVHPTLRGRGLGRSLVQAAEAEARRRGCAQLLLSTHSFQAPDFYRKLGFERLAEIADYPAGHSHVLLRKRLR